MANGDDESTSTSRNTTCLPSIQLPSLSTNKRQQKNQCAVPRIMDSDLIRLHRRSLGLGFPSEFIRSGYTRVQVPSPEQQTGRLHTSTAHLPHDRTIPVWHTRQPCTPQDTLSCLPPGLGAFIPSSTEGSSSTTPGRDQSLGPYILQCPTIRITGGT
jgi:hypothetical protein